MERPASTPMRVPVTDRVVDYVLANSIRQDEAQARLIDRTQAEVHDVAGMQVPPEQGALLTLLARLVRARRAIEIGTFTGYSAISIARGLEPGGSLLCCDINEDWTSIARHAWAEAGVEDVIELRIGPAIETVRGLPREETFELCFVDADKTGYAGYFEELLPRTRPGGVLLFDNVLFGGRVLERESNGNAAALQEFNPRLAADPRVDVVMLPIADGLTIARKR